MKVNNKMSNFSKTEAWDIKQHNQKSFQIENQKKNKSSFKVSLERANRYDSKTLTNDTNFSCNVGS